MHQLYCWWLHCITLQIFSSKHNKRSILFSGPKVDMCDIVFRSILFTVWHQRMTLISYVGFMCLSYTNTLNFCVIYPSRATDDYFIKNYTKVSEWKTSVSATEVHRISLYLSPLSNTISSFSLFQGGHEKTREPMATLSHRQQRASL